MMYVKIPEKFVCLIFQNRSWVVHILLACMFKFQFLAQFPEYHLAHPVMSIIIIIIIIILFNFHLYFWWLTIFHQVINQDLG